MSVLSSHRHAPLQRNSQTHSSVPRDTPSFSHLRPASVSVQLIRQQNVRGRKREGIKNRTMLKQHETMKTFTDDSEELLA